MESPQTISSPSSLGHMALKGRDDAISLTSFNPFSEEDENDQSSYALVTSLFSKVKNSLASIPLSSNPTSPPPSSITNPPSSEARRPSGTQSPPTRPLLTERPHSLTVVASHPAPPLVSLTPVISELPSFNPEYDRNSPQTGVHFPSLDPSNEGYHLYAGAIPGFPIPDDARSIRTSVSMPKSKSVSKVIRKIRGEGTFYFFTSVSVFSFIPFKAYLATIGWTMRNVKSAPIVRASLRLGGGSITAGSAARYFAPDAPPISSKEQNSAKTA